MVLGVVKMRGKLRNLIGQFFFRAKKGGGTEDVSGKKLADVGYPYLCSRQHPNVGKNIDFRS